MLPFCHVGFTTGDSKEEKVVPTGTQLPGNATKTRELLDGQFYEKAGVFQPYEESDWAASVHIDTDDTVRINGWPVMTKVNPNSSRKTRSQAFETAKKLYQGK